LSHLRILGSHSVGTYDSQGLRWTYFCPPPHGGTSELKGKVTLRLTFSQSVCLGVGHPFVPHDQILLFPFFCRKIALVSSRLKLFGTDRTENTVPHCCVTLYTQKTPKNPLFRRTSISKQRTLFTELLLINSWPYSCLFSDHYPAPNMYATIAYRVSKCTTICILSNYN
jgi:hypothetical protein